MTDTLTFQVHSAARGPRWVGWSPFRRNPALALGLSLVAATREEAEARARAWAQRVSDATSATTSS
jgi:hypothetical protein